MSSTRRSALLAWDAVINLVLGALLVAFPESVVSALGVPSADQAFYPSILGAVLVGVGIALLIERRKGSSGLGLHGAIAINICGGLGLAVWLVLGDLDLPLRGVAFLWGLVLVLVGLSGAELWHELRKKSEVS